MTANVLPQQVAGLKAAGMDDHVGKPFRMPELLAAVDKWTPNETAAPVFPASMTATDERFDHEAFAAMEDMIGASAFRITLAKFAATLATDFEETASSDPNSLSRLAHAMIQPAGVFGFKRLLMLLRRCERAKDTQGLHEDLKAERRLVATDIERYLAGS